MNYPTINLNDLRDRLTDEQFDIARRIVNTSTGQLRASKPKLARKLEVANDGRQRYGKTMFIYPTQDDKAQGDAAYVWRMVAFFASPNHQHQCMPCTAEFDICDSWGDTRKRAKELDALVDVITSTIPLRKQYGAVRWGRALGII